MKASMKTLTAEKREKEDHENEFLDITGRGGL